MNHPTYIYWVPMRHCTGHGAFKEKSVQPLASKSSRYIQKTNVVQCAVINAITEAHSRGGFFNTVKEAPDSFLYWVLSENCPQISLVGFGPPHFLGSSFATHCRGEKIAEGIIFSCTKDSLTHPISGTVLHLCISLLNK